MKKAIAIINEQHNLLPEQEKILKRIYKKFTLYKIPASGLNKNQIIELESKLHNRMQENIDIVFVSPIPMMISGLARTYGYQTAIFPDDELGRVLVFHNDRREKKELPNGKVISVTAKTGWELV